MEHVRRDKRIPGLATTLLTYLQPWIRRRNPEYPSFELRIKHSSKARRRDRGARNPAKKGNVFLFLVPFLFFSLLLFFCLQNENWIFPLPLPLSLRLEDEDTKIAVHLDDYSACIKSI